MEEVRRRGFVIRDAQIGREWVGLTDAEVNGLARWVDEHAAPFHLEFAKAIESKLKEKNGG